ncbi:hypothetical protein J2S74_002947 [Evansella vedderi]|uniref:DUF4241 domain-containing protein n=1 Tax=Evansella vedderi TaxID=38282 RepID=A0ABT9ZZQ1_9BACI|nr:DUF4241 domain-containing protein [Evansella vedderi]MDQ0255565.1 hypothetical protein [Evansella vedderi]
MNRKKIGAVAVDSGQLMIIDPCYIESYWEKNENVEPEGIEFWGGDAEQIVEHFNLEETYGVQSNEGGSYTVLTGDYKDLSKEIGQYANQNKLGLIVTEYSPGSTYKQVSDANMNQERTGACIHGHGGFPLGLSFASGYGDGLYDVYATYNEDGVIVKVEIEMD